MMAGRALVVLGEVFVAAARAKDVEARRLEALPNQWSRAGVAPGHEHSEGSVSPLLTVKLRFVMTRTLMIRTVSPTLADLTQSPVSSLRQKNEEARPKTSSSQAPWERATGASRFPRGRLGSGNRLLSENRRTGVPVFS
jgi:hypothetical protein